MRANGGKIPWEPGFHPGILYRLWQVKLPVGPLLIRGRVLGNDSRASRNGCGL